MSNHSQKYKCLSSSQSKRKRRRKKTARMLRKVEKYKKNHHNLNHKNKLYTRSLVKEMNQIINNLISRSVVESFRDFLAIFMILPSSLSKIQTLRALKLVTGYKHKQWAKSIRHMILGFLWIRLLSIMKLKDYSLNYVQIKKLKHVFK